MSVALLLAVATLCASCGQSRSSRSAPVTIAPSPPSTLTGVSSSLAAPETSPAQDADYLADVAQADSTLGSYIQAQGNVALRALLTDGSAFCAFLQRGGIDNAMASLVVGAKSIESETHLPSTVTTFNTIDAVALLTLCPSEQSLIPASDQAKIHSLGKALGQQTG